MSTHVFYQSGDGHPCNDMGECNLCVLSVCKICGLAEGSLTTDCPGDNVPPENDELVYSGRIDYRVSEGGWVNKLNPSMQSNLQYHIFQILEGKSEYTEAALRLNYGVDKEEYTTLKAKCVKYLSTRSED